jgi:hypothetical protein
VGQTGRLDHITVPAPLSPGRVFAETAF